MSWFDVRFDHALHVGDLVALEFIAAAKAADGDAAYGDTSATGSFNARTDATLSQMASLAQTFWSTGVVSAGDSSASTGLSTTAAKEYFDGYQDGPTTTGRWQYATGTSVTGRSRAMALRGWYAYFGNDATCAAQYAWLMAGSSNATYESSATAKRQQLSQASTGTYDPTLALATYLAADASNSSSFYEWCTVGLMAELHSALDQAAFAEGKRQGSALRRRAYNGLDERQERPSLRGRTGLTYQVFFTESILGSNRRVYDLVAAAMFANSYRVAPVIYTVRDHGSRW